MGMTLFDFGATMMASGRVGNPQVGTYVGQCVSLIQQYLYLCYGVDYAPRGNAKDFVPPKFHRVTDGTIRKGDIIRYGANYGGGYGHIGMIVWTGTYMDQNGVRPLAIGKRDKPFAGYESVWRPDNGIEMGGPSGNNNWDTTDIPAGVTPQEGTYHIQVNGLRVRSTPEIRDDNIVASYDAGQQINHYQGYIDANGYRWVVYKAKSGNWRYIARRSLDGKEVFGYCD